MDVVSILSLWLCLLHCLLMRLGCVMKTAVYNYQNPAEEPSGRFASEA